MKPANEILRSLATGARRMLLTKVERDALNKTAEMLELQTAIFNEADKRVDQARRVLVQELPTLTDPIVRKLALEAIDELDDWTGPYSGENDGQQRLDLWFELSRASFLTLPRVQMNAMPDIWKMRMADLLCEADSTFPNAPDMTFTVRGKDHKTGRMTALPTSITNYRHPDRDAIELWKGVVQ